MLIVANWKAYVTDVQKAKKLFSVSKRLARATKIDIVLAPPAPILGMLSLKNKTKVALSAQDISIKIGGAQTGEIPASIYTSVGATYAIIGHSERRSIGDTNEIISKKLASAIVNGLTPILCVGESERDGEGRYLSVIREELTLAMEPLVPKDRSKIIVAYEPLWAIGKNATFAIGSNDLAEMILYIRKVLAELLPGKSASRALVIYGGSVEPENIRALAASSGVDGFLIGHASTDPVTFSLIAKQLI